MKRQWWNGLNYNSSQFLLPCPQKQISPWKHWCCKNTWMPSTTYGHAQSTSRNSLMKRSESTLGNTHCSCATWGVPSAMWPSAVQHLSPTIWKLNTRDLSLIVGHVARNTPALKHFANMPKKYTAWTNSGVKNVTEHLHSRASWPNMQPVMKKQALTCVMNVETCTRLYVLWESIWRYTASYSTFVRNVVTLWRRRGFWLNTCWAGTQKPGDTHVWCTKLHSTSGPNWQDTRTRAKPQNAASNTDTSIALCLKTFVCFEPTSSPVVTVHKHFLFAFLIKNVVFTYVLNQNFTGIFGHFLYLELLFVLYIARWKKGFVVKYYLSIIASLSAADTLCLNFVSFFFTLGPTNFSRWSNWAVDMWKLLKKSARKSLFSRIKWLYSPSWLCWVLIGCTQNLCFPFRLQLMQ